MKNYLTVVLIVTFVSFRLAAQNPSTGNPANSSGEITVTVMPNPVKNGTVIFKLEGLKNTMYQVKIISDKGALAATEKFNSPTGTTFRLLQLQQRFKGYGRVQILDPAGKVVGQSRFLILD